MICASLSRMVAVTHSSSRLDARNAPSLGIAQATATDMSLEPGEDTAGLAEPGAALVGRHTGCAPASAVSVPAGKVVPGTAADTYWPALLRTHCLLARESCIRTRDGSPIHQPPTSYFFAEFDADECK
jgi:hypothetical protein